MNKKAWIIHFMSIKDKIINWDDFMLTSDWEWLMDLNDDDVEIIYTKIRKIIGKMVKDGLDGMERINGIADAEFCPWCIYFKSHASNSCAACAYSEEHGLCNSHKSTYQKVTAKSLVRTQIKHNIKRFEILFSIKTVVKSRTEIVRQLLKDGYEFNENGDWVDLSKDIPIFLEAMFDYCGKEPHPKYIWNKEWLVKTIEE